ncbi:MAG TPA: hypothetical protein VGR28_06870 [Candidatus Thermoplasmatota archaeon]|jgi:hypothetical protein|nr:hypothetical protein [Candidatus Thermoplasmatota archaeon]
MPGAEPAIREGLAFKGKHWRLWAGLDGVVRGLIEGDHDRAGADDILDALAQLGDKVPERPFRFMLYAHRTLRLTPDARERFTEALRAHLTVRVALVRPSPLAKIQARAIARHSGHEFVYTDNEPDALRALGVPEPAPKPVQVEARTPDVGIVDHIA